jgi:hypothetical protein
MLLFFCRQNEGGEAAGGHRKLPLLGIGPVTELVLIGSTAVSGSLFAAEALAGTSREHADGRHSL